MSWVWTDVFSHPLWAVSTVILGLLLRSQQRGSWDTRACLVQLKGKTAIVTGANTGNGFSWAKFLLDLFCLEWFIQLDSIRISLQHLHAAQTSMLTNWKYNKINTFYKSELAITLDNFYFSN